MATFDGARARGNPKLSDTPRTGLTLIEPENDNLSPAITPPPAVVTPDDDGARHLEAGGALSLPPNVPAHDAMAAARVAGYDWDGIEGYANDRSAQALAIGYSQREIDAYLGWPDPQPFIDRTRQQWDGRIAADPTLADAMQLPDPIKDLSGDWLRQDYARALTEGTVKNPADFADQYVRSFITMEGPAGPDLQQKGDEAARQLATTLPTQRDATDFALAITADAGMPMTPATIAGTKSNLLDHWADTGEPFRQIYDQAQADPALRDQLATPPRQPKTWTLGDALGRIYDAAKQGAEDAYGAPLAGGPDDWGISTPESTTGVIGNAKLLAFIAAKDVDALARLPSAAIQGAARSGAQLLKEAGVSEQDADTTMRDALALATAIGAKEAPMRVRVFDPLKAPTEAVSEVPAAEAYAAPTPTPSPAYDAAGAVFSHFDRLMANEEGSLKVAAQNLFRTPAQALDAAEQAAARDFAQATIRKFRGMADREISAHFNSIEEYRAAINEHMPEYARWLRMGPNRPPDKPVIANLIDYIEGRSSGATLDPKSSLAPVADALRSINESMRADIEAYAPDFAHFYDDYYRHLWTDPRQADRVFGAGRQGSSASLQARSIATVSEGIERGLTPKILDPIENTLHYASGMLNYLAARRTLDASREAGYVKYGTRSPEPGWLPLDGMASVLPAGEDAVQRAYAPPGFASSYNNWVGKGFYRWPWAGAIYDKLQFAANAMTGMKLAFSGYHFLNIAKETGIAQLANGIGEISRGDLLSGLRDMGYGATILPGIVDYARRGAAFQRRYLDLVNGNDEVVNLLTQAGFRPLGRSRRYAGVTAPDVATMVRGASAFQLAKRGALGWQLTEEFRRIGGDADTEAPLYRALATGPRAAGFFVNQIGRVLDTFNAPLFDALIPKVKAGAAASEMEAWLRRNPAATQDQKLAIARKISDSMDDRFGELNQDNLFWPRAIKQALNLATVSVGWEYGTLRAFGGAAHDILSGDLGSTRARWLMAFPMMTAITAAIYQYLHTGQLPQSARDLVLPRTGGTTPDGLAPERALAPGYEKDPMQWYKALFSAPNFMSALGNVSQVTTNKLNPFWQAVRGTVSGQDAIGHYIYNEPNPPLQSWGLPPDFANWLRFMGDQFAPIAVENKPLRGTNITNAERLLGYRAPALFFENPAEAARRQQNLEIYRNRIEGSRARKEAAQEE